MSRSFDFETEFDELAEKLILVDPTDSVALEQIIARYTRFTDCAHDNELETMAGLAERSLQILAELPSPESVENNRLMSELGHVFTDLREAPRKAEYESTGTGRTTGEVAAAALAEDSDLIDDFVARAREHLEDADEQLLRLERAPGDLEALNSTFRAFHTIKGMAGFLGMEEIEHASHLAEGVLDGPRKGKGPLAGEDFDTIFAHIDQVRALITCIETGANESSDDNVGNAEDTTSAPAAAPNRARSRETVRVYESRLNRMLDMIGELVIAESTTAEEIRQRNFSDSAIEAKVARLDKITRNLQEIATSLRMVPLKATFRSLSRLARDVSRKSGKQVECIIVGEDIEIDKTVVDAIGDPLMHLVRNAIDHGIEADPAMRETAAKPAAGQVRIEAEQIGSAVQICVSDDGMGFDLEAIALKAGKPGGNGHSELTEKEAIDLLFSPGFTTTKRVSDISGRGVGLDVVRRTIDSLRGSIDVKNEPGKGTTFKISLPLTLAIIDGMVARVGTERYIIPTLSILRSVRPANEQLTSVLGREKAMRTKEGLVPLVHLSDIFDIDGAIDDPASGIIVIIGDGENRAGLVVCELLGQQQTVIKPLSDAMRNTPGISGGAVMADGSVGLIVDVTEIVRLAQSEKGVSE